MTELAPHQQRVVAEAQALADSLNKLMAFGETEVFDKLPDQEQALLTAQSEIMDDYLSVLQQRIAGFRGFKVYTCHKQVLAKPMTRGEYIDGGEPNHPAFNGYISWSPKGVFDNGYTENT